jgi:hypothetical protein
MKRWLAGAAVVLVVLAGAFARDTEAPAAQQQSPEPGAAVRAAETVGTGEPRFGDSVQLRHEIIEIKVPARAAPRQQRSGKAVAPAPRAESRRPRFVERARRALVGDGRYRPEPFPRPGTH